MNKNRLEAFSYGVLAIIITKMCFGIKSSGAFQLSGVNAFNTKIFRVCTEFYLCWNLLEQPSPHDAYRKTG